MPKNQLTPAGQNELGAAFGLYPSMGRRRVQDPIGATEVPLQLIRGRVAGTLGMPSDVLNTVRSPMPMEAFGDVDYSQQKLLPYGTSQLLKELPLAPTSRVGEVAGEIGSVAPITPMEALQAARVARQAALAGEKAATGGKFVFPQENALKLAQQRAALPVEQNGLGLRPDNTAAERAAAMNFENRGFHETEGANIESGLSDFDVRRVGAAASDEQTPYAMFIKPHGENIGVARKNQAQMPLMVKSNLTDENVMQAFGNREELQSYLNQFPEIQKATKAVRDLDHQMANYMGEIEKKSDALYAQGKKEEADKLLDSLNFDSNLMKEFDARNNELAAISKEKITELFKSKGIGTIGLTNDKGAFGRSTVTEMVLDPNENVRSRFAAFDPWRRNAAIAAAMGVAAPNLMAQDKNQLRKGR
jgi:hypothetical protein